MPAPRLARMQQARRVREFIRKVRTAESFASMTDDDAQLNLIISLDDDDEVLKELAKLNG